ncbi:MAG TPA: HAMP domain-containing sensor histidine kinase [Acidimicrobiales bacterium]|nr:HAMP domain-containing sensor histidine kinase [Acidimicrobiales bacterium]
MSLRSRLLLVVVGLVAVALTVTNVVTYRALRSFLLHRVDQQLAAARDPVAHQLFEDRRRQSTTPVSDTLVPAGTYAAVVDDRGVLQRSATFDYAGHADPDRAHPAWDGDDLRRDSPFTVGSTRGSARYRVEVSSFGLQGNRLLLAIPLGEVTSTLRRLLALAVTTTLVGLVLAGVAALALVRAGLRPLDDIGEVAGAIAEGDLSKRVPRAEPRTEVGRLGLSLNAMLGQIQSAFEARQASEARLRRFVADASHELRTPLTSIRGSAALFRRGAAERREDLANAMRRIEEEASRMGVLVDDLLLLARLDQGRPLEQEPVDLTRVAADAVDDARAAAPDRAISLDAPPRLVVTGDDVRLRQVAANLLSNACEHTPAGSAVDVRLGTEDGSAVLEVADHGPGLDPEQGAKVFERFYRADPSRTRAGGGAGLGLSIVAAIAAAHGGTATVDTTPGEGARFRLPLARPNGAGEVGAAARAPDGTDEAVDAGTPS